MGTHNRRSIRFSLASLIIICLACTCLAFWLGLHFDVRAAVDIVQEKSIETTDEIVSTEIPAREDISESMINDVWKILRQRMYIDETVAPQDIEFGMIKGMVSSLGDPYTVFLDPSETIDFHISVDGELEGIGAEIGKRNGNYVIMNVVKGAPAFQVGLQPDDIIIRVDSQNAKDLDFETLINSIRGPKGSEVTLSIARESDSSILDFVVTRDAIQVPSIEAVMLEDGIGHIMLNQFSPNTDREFRQAYNDLSHQGLQALILDVRDNSGGYLEQAKRIVSAFLSEGNVIQTETADGNRTYLPVSGSTYVNSDLPLVMLVNKFSASASEITAGTLQDYDRATIIGETTFGKGTVQEAFTFPSGSTLKFTTAQWLTGKGNPINKVGVVPDQEVEMVDQEEGEEEIDEQLEAAISFLRKGN